MKTGFGNSLSIYVRHSVVCADESLSDIVDFHSLKSSFGNIRNEMLAGIAHRMPQVKNKGQEKQLKRKNFHARL